MNYDNYKTDQARARVAAKVPTQHYSILMDWEEQATDPECKSVLAHYAWRAFHIDTM